MSKIMMALAAASLTVPVVALPSIADAKSYHGRSYNSSYCRKRGGTTGAVVGGVGGGLAGNVIAGGTVGTLVGAGAGALIGRQVERNKKRSNCYKDRRYYRR